MVRELKPVFREPASVPFGMLQPLVCLGLFAALLPMVENGSALQWFVRGDVGADGRLVHGANLAQEISAGSHERLLVSPLSRSSLMVGRALKEVVPMPHRHGPCCRCSASALEPCRSRWRRQRKQTLIFPVLLLAGLRLPPLRGAPGWLQTAADLNPAKYVVEAERELFAGSFPLDTVAYGFVGAAGSAHGETDICHLPSPGPRLPG